MSIYYDTSTDSADLESLQQRSKGLDFLAADERFANAPYEEQQEYIDKLNEMNQSLTIERPGQNEIEESRRALMAEDPDAKPPVDRYKEWAAAKGQWMKQLHQVRHEADTAPEMERGMREKIREAYDRLDASGMTPENIQEFRQNLAVAKAEMESAELGMISMPFTNPDAIDSRQVQSEIFGNDLQYKKTQSRLGYHSPGSTVMDDIFYKGEMVGFATYNSDGTRDLEVDVQYTDADYQNVVSGLLKSGERVYLSTSNDTSGGYDDERMPAGERVPSGTTTDEFGEEIVLYKDGDNMQRMSAKEEDMLFRRAMSTAGNDSIDESKRIEALQEMGVSYAQVLEGVERGVYSVNFGERVAQEVYGSTIKPEPYNEASFNKWLASNPNVEEKWQSAMTRFNTRKGRDMKVGNAVADFFTSEAAATLSFAAGWFGKDSSAELAEMDDIINSYKNYNFRINSNRVASDRVQLQQKLYGEGGFDASDLAGASRLDELREKGRGIVMNAAGSSFGIAFTLPSIAIDKTFGSAEGERVQIANENIHANNIQAEKWLQTLGQNARQHLTKEGRKNHDAVRASLTKIKNFIDSSPRFQTDAQALEREQQLKKLTNEHAQLVFKRMQGLARVSDTGRDIGNAAAYDLARNNGLAAELYAYKATGDPRHLERIDTLTLMTPEQRGVDDHIAELHKARGYDTLNPFLKGIFTGQTAGWQEMGVEAGSLLVGGAITKTALRSSVLKKAEQSMRGGRQVATNRTWRDNPVFQDAPATGAMAKLKAGATALAGNVGSEAVEEGIVALGESNTNLDKIFEQMMAGAIGGGGIAVGQGVLMTPLAMDADARVEAQLKAEGKMTKQDLQDNMGKITEEQIVAQRQAIIGNLEESFSPLSAIEFEKSKATGERIEQMEQEGSETKALEDIEGARTQAIRDFEANNNVDLTSPYFERALAEARVEDSFDTLLEAETNYREEKSEANLSKLNAAQSYHDIAVNARNDVIAKEVESAMMEISGVDNTVSETEDDNEGIEDFNPTQPLSNPEQANEQQLRDRAGMINQQLNELGSTPQELQELSEEEVEAERQQLNTELEAIDAQLVDRGVMQPASEQAAPETSAPTSEQEAADAFADQEAANTAETPVEPTEADSRLPEGNQQQSKPTGRKYKINKPKTAQKPVEQPALSSSEGSLIPDMDAPTADASNPAGEQGGGVNKVDDFKPPTKPSDPAKVDAFNRLGINFTNKKKVSAQFSAAAERIEREVADEATAPEVKQASLDELDAAIEVQQLRYDFHSSKDNTSKFKHQEIAAKIGEDLQMLKETKQRIAPTPEASEAQLEAPSAPASITTTSAADIGATTVKPTKAASTKAVDQADAIIVFTDAKSPKAHDLKVINYSKTGEWQPGTVENTPGANPSGKKVLVVSASMPSAARNQVTKFLKENPGMKVHVEGANADSGFVKQAMGGMAPSVAPTQEAVPTAPVKEATPTIRPKPVVAVKGSVQAVKQAERAGEGVNVLRKTKGDDKHYGNPFTHLKGPTAATRKVDTIEQAVESYTAWLEGTAHQEVEPRRREWILEQIDSGALDGKTLLYHADTPVSHANALADFVSQRARGVNISNKADNEAGRYLANAQPAKMTFRGKEYESAEHAYQTWKSGEFDQASYDAKGSRASRKVDRATSAVLMQEILQERMKQDPAMVEMIDANGGLAFLEKSTHKDNGRNKAWESSSKDRGAFMQTLIEAYKKHKSAAKTSKPKPTRRAPVKSSAETAKTNFKQQQTLKSRAAALMFPDKPMAPEAFQGSIRSMLTEIVARKVGSGAAIGNVNFTDDVTFIGVKPTLMAADGTVSKVDINVNPKIIEKYIKRFATGANPTEQEKQLIVAHMLMVLDEEANHVVLLNNTTQAQINDMAEAMKADKVAMATVAKYWGVKPDQVDTKRPDGMSDNAWNMMLVAEFQNIVRQRAVYGASVADFWNWQNNFSSKVREIIKKWIGDLRNLFQKQWNTSFSPLVRKHLDRLNDIYDNLEAGSEQEIKKELDKALALPDASKLRNKNKPKDDDTTSPVVFNPIHRLQPGANLPDALADHFGTLRAVDDFFRASLKLDDRVAQGAFAINATTMQMRLRIPEALINDNQKNRSLAGTDLPSLSSIKAALDAVNKDNTLRDAVFRLQNLNGKEELSQLTEAQRADVNILSAFYGLARSTPTDEYLTKFVRRPIQMVEERKHLLSKLGIDISMGNSTRSNPIAHALLKLMGGKLTLEQLGYLSNSRSKALYMKFNTEMASDMYRIWQAAAEYFSPAAARESRTTYTLNNRAFALRLYKKKALRGDALEFVKSKHSDWFAEQGVHVGEVKPLSTFSPLLGYRLYKPSKGKDGFVATDNTSLFPEEGDTQLRGLMSAIEKHLLNKTPTKGWEVVRNTTAQDRSDVGYSIFFLNEGNLQADLAYKGSEQGRRNSDTTYTLAANWTGRILREFDRNAMSLTYVNRIQAGDILAPLYAKNDAPDLTKLRTLVTNLTRGIKRRANTDAVQLLPHPASPTTETLVLEREDFSPQWVDDIVELFQSMRNLGDLHHPMANFGGEIYRMAYTIKQSLDKWQEGQDMVEAVGSNFLQNYRNLLGRVRNVSDLLSEMGKQMPRQRNAYSNPLVDMALLRRLRDMSADHTLLNPNPLELERYITRNIGFDDTTLIDYLDGNAQFEGQKGEQFDNVDAIRENSEFNQRYRDYGLSYKSTDEQAARKRALMALSLHDLDFDAASEWLAQYDRPAELDQQLFALLDQRVEAYYNNELTEGRVALAELLGNARNLSDQWQATTKQLDALAGDSEARQELREQLETQLAIAEQVDRSDNDWNSATNEELLEAQDVVGLRGENGYANTLLRRVQELATAIGVTDEHAARMIASDSNLLTRGASVFSFDAIYGDRATPEQLDMFKRMTARLRNVQAEVMENKANMVYYRTELERLNRSKAPTMEPLTQEAFDAIAQNILNHEEGTLTIGKLSHYLGTSQDAVITEATDVLGKMFSTSFDKIPVVYYNSSTLDYDATGFNTSLVLVDEQGRIKGVLVDKNKTRADNPHSAIVGQLITHYANNVTDPAMKALVGGLKTMLDEVFSGAMIEANAAADAMALEATLREFSDEEGLDFSPYALDKAIDAAAFEKKAQSFYTRQLEEIEPVLAKFFQWTGAPSFSDMTDGEFLKSILLDDRLQQILARLPEGNAFMHGTITTASPEVVALAQQFANLMETPAGGMIDAQASQLLNNADATSTTQQDMGDALDDAEQEQDMPGDEAATPMMPSHYMASLGFDAGQTLLPAYITMAFQALDGASKQLGDMNPALMGYTGVSRDSAIGTDAIALLDYADGRSTDDIIEERVRMQRERIWTDWRGPIPDGFTGTWRDKFLAIQPDSKVYPKSGKAQADYNGVMGFERQAARLAYAAAMEEGGVYDQLTNPSQTREAFAKEQGYKAYVRAYEERVLAERRSERRAKQASQKPALPIFSLDAVTPDDLFFTDDKRNDDGVRLGILEMLENGIPYVDTTLVEDALDVTLQAPQEAQPEVDALKPSEVKAFGWNEVEFGDIIPTSTMPWHGEKGASKKLQADIEGYQKLIRMRLYAVDEVYANMVDLNPNAAPVKAMHHLIATTAAVAKNGAFSQQSRDSANYLLQQLVLGKRAMFFKEANKLRSWAMAKWQLNEMLEGVNESANTTGRFMHNDAIIQNIVSNTKKARRHALVTVAEQDFGLLGDTGRNAWKNAQQQLTREWTRLGSKAGIKDSTQAYVVSMLLNVDANAPLSVKKQLDANLAMLKAAVARNNDAKSWANSAARERKLETKWAQQTLARAEKIYNTYMGKRDTLTADMLQDLQTRMLKGVDKNAVQLVELGKQWFAQKMPEMELMLAMRGRKLEAATNYMPMRLYDSSTAYGVERGNDGVEIHEDMSNVELMQQFADNARLSVDFNPVRSMLSSSNSILYQLNTFDALEKAAHDFGSDSTKSQIMNVAQGNGVAPTAVLKLTDALRHVVRRQEANDLSSSQHTKLYNKIFGKLGNLGFIQSLTSIHQFLAQTVPAVTVYTLSHPHKGARLAQNMVKMLMSAPAYVYNRAFDRTDVSEANYMQHVGNLIEKTSPELFARSVDGINELKDKASKANLKDFHSPYDLLRAATLGPMKALMQLGNLGLHITTGLPDSLLTRALFATEYEFETGRRIGSMDVDNVDVTAAVMARVEAEKRMAQSDSSKKGDFFQHLPADTREQRMLELARKSVGVYGNQILSQQAQLAPAVNMLKSKDNKAYGARILADYVGQVVTFNAIKIPNLAYIAGGLAASLYDGDEEKKKKHGEKVQKAFLDDVNAMGVFGYNDTRDKNAFAHTFFVKAGIETLGGISGWSSIPTLNGWLQTGIQNAMNDMDIYKNEKPDFAFTKTHGALRAAGAPGIAASTLVNIALQYATARRDYEFGREDAALWMTLFGGLREQRTELSKRVGKANNSRRYDRLNDKNKTPVGPVEWWKGLPHALRSYEPDKRPEGFSEADVKWSHMALVGDEELQGYKHKYTVDALNRLHNDGDSFAVQTGFLDVDTVRLIHVDTPEKQWLGEAKHQKDRMRMQARSNNATLAATERMGKYASYYRQQLIQAADSVEVYTDNKVVFNAKPDPERERIWARAIAVMPNGDRVDIGLALMENGLAQYTSGGSTSNTDKNYAQRVKSNGSLAKEKKLKWYSPSSQKSW